MVELCWKAVQIFKRLISYHGSSTYQANHSALKHQVTRQVARFLPEKNIKIGQCFKKLDYFQSKRFVFLHHMVANFLLSTVSANTYG